MGKSTRRLTLALSLGLGLGLGLGGCNVPLPLPTGGLQQAGCFVAVLDMSPSGGMDAKDRCKEALAALDAGWTDPMQPMWVELLGTGPGETAEPVSLAKRTLLQVQPPASRMRAPDFDPREERNKQLALLYDTCRAGARPMNSSPILRALVRGVESVRAMEGALPEDQECGKRVLFVSSDFNENHDRGMYRWVRRYARRPAKTKAPDALAGLDGLVVELCGVSQTIEGSRIRDAALDARQAYLRARLAGARISWSPHCPTTEKFEPARKAGDR